MRLATLLAGLAVLALALAQTARAQVTTAPAQAPTVPGQVPTVPAQAPTAPAQNPRGGHHDNHFVQAASAAGLAEVNLSNLALRMAANPAVRTFAQQMVTDHTMANTQLLGILNTQGRAAARTMDQAHQAKEKQLLKLTGARFDREYVECMVRDHEDAVKLFEAEANHGRDAALKAFAKNTLPTLRHHLDMVNQLASTMGIHHEGHKDHHRTGEHKDDHKSDEHKDHKDQHKDDHKDDHKKDDQKKD